MRHETCSSWIAGRWQMLSHISNQYFLLLCICKNMDAPGVGEALQMPFKCPSLAVETDEFTLITILSHR